MLSNFLWKTSGCGKASVNWALRARRYVGTNFGGLGERRPISRMTIRARESCRKRIVSENWRYHETSGIAIAPAKAARSRTFNACSLGFFHLLLERPHDVLVQLARPLELGQPLLQPQTVSGGCRDLAQS